ncbi:DUF3267 domain-containing protein [Paenibacillus sp. y28]|uniref:DUF3267 domain-containing protein n=1 Tax=Paenibacillus sp. y28 TaxID=3129110 RepID=UPI003016C286
MKIVTRLPAVNQQKHLDLLNEGWVLLKEPRTMAMALLCSVPLMLLGGFVTFGLIALTSDISWSMFGFEAQSFSMTIRLDYILALILLLLIHESLHLLFIPHFISSTTTLIGLTYAGGFVYTEQELSKSRYIVITVAPYIVISLVLPLLFGALGIFTPLLKLAVLLNALASSVDMLNLLIVSGQVPSRARIKSNGSNTYWRPEARGR